MGGRDSAVALSRHNEEEKRTIEANNMTSSKDQSSHDVWPNEVGFNAVTECTTPKELLITGTFPSYVAGSLYRTGPGFYKIPRQNPEDGTMTCSHWFDGFTTMHKFDIQSAGDGGSRVFYSSRRQVDELVETARKTGKLDGITFGQKRDPCDTFYKKIKSVFEPVMAASPSGLNAGVTIRATMPAESDCIAKQSGHHNAEITSNGNTKCTLTSTTDAHVVKQFDADTLEPIGVTQQRHLHPSLKGPLSGAHAQVDPETGDIFNYNLELTGSATYRVFQSSPVSGETKILAQISSLDIKGAYIHSMFLTQNFVVLCVWPAFFSARGAGILWHRNLMDAMAFDPSAKTTWLVVDRRKGRGLVKKFRTPSFFCFHTVNAWEEEVQENGEVDILCELVQFDNMDILHHFYYENLMSKSSNPATKGKRSPFTTALTLYRLPNVPHAGGTSSQTGTAKLVRSIPSPKAGDLPTINPRYALKPHRYVYATLHRGLSTFIDGLVKTDTFSSSCIIWDHPAHTPGEPVFVMDPQGTREDDGVVLSVVLDGIKGTSYLICLDAKTMTEVARAEVNGVVGFGFHGVHIASS